MPQPLRWFKLNFDGSFNHLTNSTGIGGIVRDSQGYLHSSFARKVTASHPLEAELVAMGERRGKGRASEEAPGPSGDCRVDCGAAVRNEDQGGLLPIGGGGWGETARGSPDFWSQSREERKKILFLMLVP
ncbi:hypothetical protein MRB53_010500 [Persea americana]|uniref:Uncharacterized protein n=1 Tax=Persea americana TaxID=3435 RepID=A0ACC2LSB2_PERAE|nr:hypothetical protein MRB53_010500 [Persea americana]